jgi:hypothetical protein
VYAARGREWGTPHPAESYRACYFEQVVEALLSTERSSTVPAGAGGFAELMERLKRRSSIAALTKSLGEAGFALI